MANSYSTSDLVKGALQRAGEQTDGTSSLHELALRYINNVYHGILAGNSLFNPDISDYWTWARTKKTFILKAFYSTGGVTLTNGSTAGVFTVAPTISQAGRYLKVDNVDTYYEIDTHTASSVNFTLKTAYLESSTTAAGFKSIPISYDLGAGFLRLVEPFRIYKQRCMELGETLEDEGQISGEDINVFREKWPLRFLKQGTPSRFATYSRSESSWKVLVNRYTSTDMLVEFDAIMIPDDLTDSTQNIPLIPREYRSILEFGSAHFLCQDKEDDKKSEYYFKLAGQQYMSMHMNEQRMLKNTNKNYGKIVPRRDMAPYPHLWWRW